MLGTHRRAKGLGAKRQLVEEEESFMYVPLLETLQMLLNDDAVLAEVKCTIHSVGILYEHILVYM